MRDTGNREVCETALANIGLGCISSHNSQSRFVLTKYVFVPYSKLNLQNYLEASLLDILDKLTIDIKVPPTVPVSHQMYKLQYCPRGWDVGLGLAWMQILGKRFFFELGQFALAPA